MPKSLGDLAEQTLRGPEPGLALGVAHGLQKAGLTGQAQLASCRILADLVVSRVVAPLQLRALEGFGERVGQAQAQPAARDDALDHCLDPARCAGRPRCALGPADRRQHAAKPARCRGKLAEGGGGASHGGGSLQRLARVEVLLGRVIGRRWRRRPAGVGGRRLGGVDDRRHRRGSRIRGRR